MADREGGRSLQRYRLHGFEATNGYIWQAVRYPALATGVHWLTRARVGALWVARSYARIRWLPAEFLARCPFCEGEAQGETLPHMLVECPRWDAQRAPLGPLVDEARDRLGAAATVENVAVYLLGGRIRGGRDGARDIRCRHWVKLGRRRGGGGAPQMGNGGLIEDGLAPQAAAAPVDGVEQQTEDAGEANDHVEAGRVPGFVLVARFLQAVMPARLAVLRPLLQIPPRADAGHGRAALQEGEGDDPPLADDAPA
jgi:hypothetical protein